jgi:hypothetical protein
MSCDCSGGGQEMQRGRGRTTRRDFKDRAGQPGSSTTGHVETDACILQEIDESDLQLLSFRPIWLSNRTIHRFRWFSWNEWQAGALRLYITYRQKKSGP